MTYALILLGAAILAVVMYGVGYHDAKKEIVPRPGDEDDEEVWSVGEQRTARLIEIHDAVLASSRFERGDGTTWRVAREMFDAELAADAAEAPDADA